MPQLRVKYHIPQTQLWNWRLVSESFVRTELTRVRNSLANLGQDEANLDKDVFLIEQAIREAWTTASATTMRNFEYQLRGLRHKRGHLAWYGKRLNEALKQIHDIGAQRGWKF